MPSESYRPTSVRSILFGIIAFIIVLSIFCGLSEVVKFIGSPFLILPEQLGWIPEVSKEDVVSLNLKNRSSELTLERTGNYVIYAYNYDLLVMTDELAEAKAKPWLKITNSQSGQVVSVDYVSRALTPFDSSLARGRPIFHFVLAEAGRYQLNYPSRDVLIFILPDQVTGNMGVILFSFCVQALILGIPIGSYLKARRKKKQASLEAIRNLKRTSDDKFWQEVRRHRDSQREKMK